MLKNYAVADLNLATLVEVPTNKQVDFALWLTLTEQQISAQDIATANLSDLIFPWAGALEITSRPEITVSELIKTTDSASLILNTKFLLQGGNPEAIFAEVLKAQTGQSYPLALRASGKFKSAFQGKDKIPEVKVQDVGDEQEIAEAKALNAKLASEHLDESSSVSNLVIVADSDFISDSFAMSAFEILGREVLSPRNDNASLFLNLVESSLNINERIGIRNKADLSRPFIKVQELAIQARNRLAEKEQELQNELEQTTQRLARLEKQEDLSEALTLSQEMIAEINQLKVQKLKILRDIREVKKLLREDIERLGNHLFMFNTFLIPVLLLLGYFVWCRRR
jgi:hypothetical protein